MHRLLRNRFFIATDILGWALIPLLALALRLDGFAETPSYLAHLGTFVVLAVVTKLVVLQSFGLYRRYWLYASIDEILLIVAAAVVAAAAAATLYFTIGVALVEVTPRLPRSVPIIDGMLTLLFVGGTRFAVRAFEHLRRKLRGRQAEERVLIIGAGDAGTLIARELRASPQLQLEPVGFIDDNPVKHGNTIHGVPVLGDCQAIPQLARDLGVTKVIIAMPNVPGTTIRAIADICEKAKLPTKIMPSVFAVLSGRVTVSQLRDVQIEDLLRRKPVETDQRAVAELVRGMTVLVTGAGGSIGSEICRQVAQLGASELILLGHGENSIFDVHQELKAKYPGVSTIPVIADIRNTARVQRIFDTFRPQAVFHAAAHKHVPLMELNPEEGVTNNIFGTINMVSAAVETGVPHFVFISTDKAVNPASVMGATKLVGETLVYDAAERTGSAFVSVRFGNVLASRGSAVPLFQKQIAAGGPVTITHPDMCRYFMTIPEAVQLVLQAAAMGKGGETFVLDMGEPVKIVDLVEDLVHLSGLEMGRDINIAFTGLRPGEKLLEELFAKQEDVGRTAHEKIFVAHNGKPETVAQLRLEELLDAAGAGDSMRLRHLLTEIVPGYRETGDGSVAASRDEGELVSVEPMEVAADFGCSSSRGPVSGAQA